MNHFCFRSIDKNTVSVKWGSGRLVLNSGQISLEYGEAVDVEVRRLGKQWVVEPPTGYTLSGDDKKHILFLTKKYDRWEKTGRL